MGKYTLDDVKNAAKKAGIYDQIDDADWKLGEQNPDALMGIVSYKIDYNNPNATAEAKALANEGANKIRASYGEYTAGTDGGKYYPTQLSPGSFDYASAPTYTDAGGYGDLTNALLQQQLNYGSFSYGAAPTYTSRNDATLEALKNDLLNREAFSYDPETDQLYSQYRKQYAREGQRATADALGAAAAASGGLPSSYAQTAAGQAANYYAAQMTDKIPELEQLAYNKYLNDYNMKLSDISTVQSYENMDRDLYNTKLQQYNTDRAFDYNAWVDQYNMINNNLNTASGLEQLQYQKYLDQLQQYNTDRSFEYNKLLDEVDSQTLERQEALNKALTAAEYGDYSLLNEMGVNTDNNSTDWQRMYELAVLRYETTGDRSLLDKLEQAAFGTGGTTGGTSAYVNGPGGYNNGTLTESQIAQMQRYYGVTADGLWGPNSAAASGGLSAESAWEKMMQSGYVPGSTGSGSGGSGSGGSGSGGSGSGGSGGGSDSGSDEGPYTVQDTVYDWMQANGDMLTSRSKNYADIQQQFNEMIRSGKSKSEVADYLVQMINKGWLSEADANRMALGAGIEI